jgi:S1-C subfamily serine protease
MGNVNPLIHVQAAKGKDHVVAQSAGAMHYACLLWQHITGNSMLRRHLIECVALVLLMVPTLSTPASAQSGRGGDRGRGTSVAIINKADSAVNNLYVAPTNAPVWGDDRLGDATIAENGRFALTLARGAPCIVDVLVVYASGQQGVELGINLCNVRALVLDGQKELSLIGIVRTSQRTPVGLFVVHNRTRADMTGVTLRPGTPNEAVLLKGPTIKPNSRTVGRFVRADGCTIQLSAEFKDEEAQILDSHDVCKAPIVVLNPPAPPVEFKVRNRGSYPLNAIFIRPVGLATWGKDRLEASVVAPRDVQVLKISPTPACLFDIKVEITGAADDVRSGINLCSGALIDVFGPEIITGRGVVKAEKIAEQPKEVKDLTILNEGGRPIKDLFVSSSRISNWGESLITAPMAAGARVVVGVERGEQCLFDIRVVYEGGREQRQMNRDICRPDEVAFGGSTVSRIDGGGPENGKVASFVNNGRTPLQALFLSPATDTHWGDDRLGNHTLANKMRLDLRLPASVGCQWDIKMVYAGDIIREQRKVDLCAQPTQSLFLRDKPGTRVSTGTGFHVSSAGHILTNNHVVEGCNQVLIARDGQPGIPLRLLRHDEDADLALLAIDGPASPSPFISFRAAGENTIRAGERVVVIGYPVRSKVGGINITEGVVSSLKGPDKDISRMQFTAPAQPGNSGGPILDQAGVAIGVVVSRLTATDDNRPAQNVNFGVSLSAVTAFLKADNVATVISSATSKALTTPEIMDTVGDAIVPIDCLD